MDRYPAVDEKAKCAARACEWRNAAIPETAVHRWNAIHFRRGDAFSGGFWLVLLGGLRVCGWWGESNYNKVPSEIQNNGVGCAAFLYRTLSFRERGLGNDVCAMRKQRDSGLGLFRVIAKMQNTDLKPQRIENPAIVETGNVVIHNATGVSVSVVRRGNTPVFIFLISVFLAVFNS